MSRKHRTSYGLMSSLFTTSVALAVILWSAGAMLLAGPASAASDCYQRTDTSARHYDASTGTTWTADWVCGNRGGVGVYVNASYDVLDGYLNTTTSWFICYQIRDPDPHSGDSSIWYYTQGDRSVDHPALHAWGFVPAVDVWTSIDPYPGVPQCPFE